MDAEDCFDGDPCTQDVCLPTGCGTYPLVCEDWQDCTDDLCFDGACVHAAAPGTCFIDGLCHEQGAEDPGTPCRFCVPQGDPYGWTSISDGPLCDGGIGVCVDAACCVPTCAEDDCSDDGCGGTCGACPAVLVCHPGAPAICAGDDCPVPGDDCPAASLCASTSQGAPFDCIDTELFFWSSFEEDLPGAPPPGFAFDGDGGSCVVEESATSTAPVAAHSGVHTMLCPVNDVNGSFSIPVLVQPSWGPAFLSLYAYAACLSPPCDLPVTLSMGEGSPTPPQTLDWSDGFQRIVLPIEGSGELVVTVEVASAVPVLVHFDDIAVLAPEGDAP